ncbi:MAG TPA: sigma-70 family RNA polymerase sigma factor [Kineosporiaceae bacterium]|nr:sigma-70 family RNA polymerase sigma factor [Kineosporiaceae bacterium]
MPTDQNYLLSDHELVADAQAGNPWAVESLIGAVRPAVLKYCRSRLATYSGGVDAADDVAQETCVAVLRVLPRYEDKGAPFAAFVYAIASNKVADAQRGFSRSALLVDEFPDQTETSPTPEEQAMAAVDRRSAMQLLNRLPDRMREVLMLRAAGLNAEQVGERVGMTANAVRVAQHRAGAKLRLIIEGSAEQRELFDSVAGSSHRPSAAHLQLAAGY